MKRLIEAQKRQGNMDPLAADVASGQEGKELVIEEEDKLTF